MKKIRFDILDTKTNESVSEHGGPIISEDQIRTCTIKEAGELTETYGYPFQVRLLMDTRYPLLSGAFPLRSADEIEQLKAQWLTDPCWDLYMTEGFEAHRSELIHYQNEVEAANKQRLTEREAKLDIEAKQLGIPGIYRLVLGCQEIQDRHQKAIAALINNEPEHALHLLKG
ncbi:hypothetical protein JI735_33735 (plasmid) [Paenibacillus sonchi]|uniref:Uncharacterized protein n=1 Tax=Paenibacillus sonchi TaxID=373687 RepID=A0A974SGG7_9BACL|nr:hypothetical protein [Paenibacillus sonchi]QQZ64614.1 hypothetical protein JI735_33735 [Paenibacillus sonchi]